MRKDLEPLVVGIFLASYLQTGGGGLFGLWPPLFLHFPSIHSLSFCSISPFLSDRGASMPPKKAAAGGKKVDQKKVQKIVEDRTFGMKNKNKSKKVQKYINQVSSNVANKMQQKVPLRPVLCSSEPPWLLGCFFICFYFIF